MPGIIVNKDHCKGCELCISACPQGIISMSKQITVKGYFHAQVHDPSRCLGCRLCAVICPDVAIEVHQQGMAYNLFAY